MGKSTNGKKNGGTLDQIVDEVVDETLNGLIDEAPADISGLGGRAKRGKAKDPAVQTPIILAPLLIQGFKVRLTGDSSLICHAWSEKAKAMMLAKQTKQAKQAREAKNPHQDYLDSLYYIGERKDEVYGFPAVAFKSAAVDACSHVEGVTKVEARGAFHINEEMIRIEGTPTMREDMVRVGMGTADIRYRGEFLDWSCEFVVRYNVNVLSPDQIVNLFNVAGFAIGVGEWRPQRDGSHGMFHVA